MTTKVVDFLNESGGSNFTETAARPPVYGEENELQSNGGNSTRSGSSHRSHVSNKSHSSSRSANSGKGEHSHSPATTPRKSNLADGTKSCGSSDTMTDGHQLSSNVCGDCEESEMSAPLGFEPEGSAANSPPYSENGTPPHLKWAENLNYLLEDSEGVELFKDFMERELDGGSEELQFWFACQGLKRKIGTTESQDNTITNIQKAIYKRYVRGDKVKCISKDIRKEIADKVSTKSSLDHCVFDAAQEEVENFMRTVTYPSFLSSDYYVQYVQNYSDSPKSSLSSGSNSARPVSQSGLLPVVHEDRELETKDFNSPLPPVANKAPSVNKRHETAVPSRRTETVTGSVLYYPRSHSSYPAHVSYAPVSAQDSELQSLSSDALTDDTVSVTDSSVDGCPHHLRKKHHRKAMKSLAQQNREFRTGLTGQIIPRTEHAPKDRNIAETDPKRFSDLLIEKLSKVLEELENTAKVEEKMRSISEVEKSEDEKLVTSFAGGKNNASASASSFIPLMSSLEMEAEPAESILDQHCSRIWASSSHHTPSYSPPLPLMAGGSPQRSKSPDRHPVKDIVAARKKGLAVPSGIMALSASANLSSLNASRAYHHKKRGQPSDFVPSAAAFDNSIEDHNAMILCGTETHRHIHHHHHHHHSSSSREAASMKKSLVEMEAQSSWRAEKPAGFVDFSNGDHVGRGRTSTRKGGSAGIRKGSETSSNIDSGISVMYDKDSMVRVTPNWTPTNEKVMKWILDSETLQEGVSASQDTDRGSSTHKRSHRLNQSTGSSQQSRPSSKSKSSTRSASVERGGVMLLSPWSGGGIPSASGILPSQPFAQDSSMPLLTPPNPTTQLEEAKRRLENQSRGAVAASPVKSKSLTGVLPKDKGRPSPTTPLPRTLPPARIVPTELDTSATSQTFDSRMGGRVPTSAPSTLQPGQSDTIIGIYMGQEPIPYRHQLPGRAITLAQIKTLVTKRGPFKYFFKRDSDEFGDGAVFEEINDDSSIVPMWQGKIVVKVEKLDLC